MCNRTMAIALNTILVCTTIVAGQINGKTEASDAQCLEASCLESASRILKGMDLSVEPCNNFYDFVCGNYANTVVIPQGYSRVSSTDLAQQQVQAQLHQSLDDLDSSKNPGPLQLVAKFYNGCLQDSWRCSDSMIDTLERYIHQYGSGWPLSVRKWNQSDYMRTATFAALFKFHFEPDKTNSKVWIPQLDENDPPLNRYYLKQGFPNNVVQAYYQYMVDIVTSMGIKRSVAEKGMNETLALEIELYQVVFTKHNDLDSHERYSKIALRRLREKFKSTGFPKAVPKYNGSEVQLAVDLETLERVNRWVAEKPKRALANWSAWRIIADQAFVFGDYFAYRTIQFNKIVKMGRVKAAPKRCITKTRKSLGFALGALYQAEYMNQLGVDALIAMFNNMKQTFGAFVQKAAWLDGDTRKASLDKVSSLRSSLSTCRDWIMNYELSRYYSGLELSDGSYDKMSRNISAFRRRIDQKSTASLTDRTSCGNFLAKSQYLAQFNFVRVAADLHTELFHDTDLPKYMNYGAAGTRIGHQMARSLGMEGRLYDVNGNLKPWSYLLSEEIYKNLTKCFVEQYSGYKVNRWKTHVNGGLTLRENIADNVGVKLAYHAYVDWAKSRSKPEAKLPGLDYTPKQMFWISMASSYCTKYRPGVLDDDYHTDTQAPSRARVNGPVSNSEEFSKDFGCHMDSLMNPRRKCKLW